MKAMKAMRARSQPTKAVKGRFLKSMQDAKAAMKAGSQPTVGAAQSIQTASDEDICEWAFGGNDAGGACLFALEENNKDVRTTTVPIISIFIPIRHGVTPPAPPVCDHFGTYGFGTMFGSRRGLFGTTLGRTFTQGRAGRKFTQTRARRGFTQHRANPVKETFASMGPNRVRKHYAFVIQFPFFNDI